VTEHIIILHDEYKHPPIKHQGA